MNYTAIRYEVNEHIATVTLHRPDKLNAFNFEMFEDLMSVMDQVDADDEVRVVIFTGEGKAFCAGADLGQGGTVFDVIKEKYGSAENSVLPDIGGLLTLRLFKSKKPMIAAINGSAVGVGATMTLPMDIRVASNKCKMGFVFARRGIVVDGAASWFLPKVVGLPQSLEWTLTGRVFDANEALNGGLVKSLHEPDQVMNAAMGLAREIADNCSPISVTYCRHLLWRASAAEHPMLAHRLESEGLSHAFKSPDALEGVMSFLQKRPAKFPSRVTENLPENFPWWVEPEF